MLTLDVSHHLKQIEDIIKKFNNTVNPTERYALLLAYNHICEEQMPIHNWIEEQARDGMLRHNGVKVDR